MVSSTLSKLIQHATCDTRDTENKEDFEIIEKLTGFVESWIEVSSHPSSSSVSSIGEEIVTTGLLVGNSYQAHRRHVQPRPYPNQLSQQQRPSNTLSNQTGNATGTSSQEEYDESDSDDGDDPVLTSSTENVSSRMVGRTTGQPNSDSDDDDDDGNATALGRRPPPPFRPQPNAFTHPPSHLTHRHSASSAIPSHHPRPSFGQRSSTRLTERRGPNHLMSPGYQADHDAALRASLTTLLSCAAAARGRPRDGAEREPEKKSGERQPAPATSNQPVGLRMLSETELMTPPQPTSAPSAQAPTPPRPARGVSAAGPSASPGGPSRQAMAGEKVKRSATPPTGGSRSAPRATKKKRTAAQQHQTDEQALFSPTMLTWVVSAGVVVLVSVVGFGAGYVIGREVGRQETLSGLGNSVGAGNASSAAALMDGGGSGGTCGAELLRGGGGGTLRRFRWGGGMSSVAA